jgi:flagellar hook assembly protein FlgD
MPKAGHLKLSIYNVRGQLVKTMIDGERPQGADQTIVWDGTNNQGSSVSSGVYFYEARTGGEVQVQKMALVK